MISVVQVLGGLHEPESLKGVIFGIFSGTSIGVIKGYTGLGM